MFIVQKPALKVLPTKIQINCLDIFLSYLFDIALELLVSNRQGVEELLQDDCGALLPGMR